MGAGDTIIWLDGEWLFSRTRRAGSRSSRSSSESQRVAFAFRLVRRGRRGGVSDDGSQTEELELAFPEL
jgi:hypothetical protein